MMLSSFERHKQLTQDFETHSRAAHVARGVLRLLRPHVLDADSSNHIHGLENNEALRHLLTNEAEHVRVLGNVRRQILTKRQQAASVALFFLQAVLQHIGAWRSWMSATKKDVSISFSDALINVDANGMLVRALLKLEREKGLQSLSIADWNRIYNESLGGERDAVAQVDAELIEQFVAAGLKPTTDDERAAAKVLREAVEAIQETRLPVEIPDIDGLEEDVRRLFERASLLQLTAVDPQHPAHAAALAAYQSLEADSLTAGVKSDADDLAVVRQELAS